MTDLTPYQKLTACQLRFYEGRPWQPAAGDFYTIVRADLELYRIEEEETQAPYDCPACGSHGMRTHAERDRSGGLRCHKCKGEISSVRFFKVRLANPGPQDVPGALEFEVEGFSTEGFGVNRIHVPAWVFKLQTPEGFGAAPASEGDAA